MHLISLSQRTDLLLIARKAAKKAYVPDSNFHVGAAILAHDGTVYTGCNCETGMFEAEICGERNAVANAVTTGGLRQGVSFIKAIAVSCVDLPEGAALSDGSPCGACRQVLSEFAAKETPIIIDDKRDGEAFSLAELLPMGFCFAASEISNVEACLSSGQVVALEQVTKKNATSEKLLQAAREVARNSYAPFSGARMGSALLTSAGDVFTGARVESSSTGLTIGSLRAAVGRAVALGNAPVSIKAMATAMIDPRKTGRELSPVRMIETELLHEFGSKETEVIASNSIGAVMIRPFSDLAL